MDGNVIEPGLGTLTEIEARLVLGSIMFERLKAGVITDLSVTFGTYEVPRYRRTYTLVE